MPNSMWRLAEKDWDLQFAVQGFADIIRTRKLQVCVGLGANSEVSVDEELARLLEVLSAATESYEQERDQLLKQIRETLMIGVDQKIQILEDLHKV